MNASIAALTAAQAVPAADAWRKTLDTLIGTDYRIETAAGAAVRLDLHYQTLGALELVECSGPPLRIADGHGHAPLAIVTLPLAGRGMFRQGRREAVIAPSGLSLFDASERTECLLDEPFHHLTLRIPHARMDQEFPGWRGLALTPIPIGCGPAAIFSSCLRAALAQRVALAPSDLKGIGDALVGLLASCLGAFSQGRRDPATRVEHYHLERIKQFVRGHLADPELDVKTVADAVGLSPSYIHRLFARQPQRLMQWVNAERLDACHRELSASNGPKRPVYLVAQDWGFNDQAHFSRVFRARFGLSPTAVRDGRPDCLESQADCCLTSDTAGTNTGSLSGKGCFRAGARLDHDL